MIFGKSAGHALEHRFIVQPAEAFLERRLLDHAGKSARVVRYCITQAVEHRARWHPDARTQHALARLEMEVEPGAPAFRLAADPVVRSAVLEPASRMGLVGRLVPG